MEYQLQEGTRKTLRTNEQGYAKEITRGRLEDILLPNIRNVERSGYPGRAQRAIESSIAIVVSMDDAMANPAWLAVDDAIREAMGVGVEEWKPMARGRARLLLAANACYVALRHGTGAAGELDASLA